jgi:M6 family metalloprotease-like protein
VILAGVLSIPAAAAVRSLRVLPHSARRPSPQAPVTPRAFPHLLQRGTFAHTGEADGPRRGNARWEPSIGRPTVSRQTPRMLSELGDDAESAFARLRALREEAAPETVRILALRVDFLEDGGLDESTGDGRFDMRAADSAKVAIDGPPHNRRYFEAHLEALGRFYDVQTNGGLVLEYDVYPQEPDSVFHLSDTATYGPWIASVSSDSILARADRFVRNSLHLADSLDTSIDWKRYQSFLVFHAGADYQGDILQDTNYDIPSFNLGLGDSTEVIVGGADSVRVNLVMVVPETVSQDGFTAALNGVMAHEFGHQLGFFDLYNVFNMLPVVGSFSLMDSGDGLYGTVADPYDSTQAVAVRGILPTSVDPWHRIVFPFFRLNVHEGHDGDLVSLDGVLERNDLMYVPIHLAEYYLCETRPMSYEADSLWALRADPETGVVLGPESAIGDSSDAMSRLNYDFLLPGAGMLIWHIDELAAAAGLASPYGSVNVFDDRRGVDVEEADGIQDIGTASSEFTGGPYDPFFKGGFSEFGPETVPSTATNDGSPTGISFSVLDSIGVTMRVRVGEPREVLGFPLGFGAGAAPKHPLNQADLDGDGFDEVLLAVGPALFAVTADGKGFADEGDRVVFATFPAPLEEGPAIGDGPSVLVRSAGRAWWFDASGSLQSVWPDDPARVRVTAGPIAAPNGVTVVGCSDGTIRGLVPEGGSARVAWSQSTGVDGDGDSVTVVAAGRSNPDGPIDIAAGTAGGRILRGGIAESTGDAFVIRGWPQPVAGGRVRDLLLVHAALRSGEDAQDLLLASTEDRSIDLKLISGASVPGWPKSLPDTIAGSPAIGDLDGDGVLEVVATTRVGDLMLWDLAGSEEPHWPKSLWHPDQVRRLPCTTGPRLWDLDGNGTIELAQLRGDGMIVVVDRDGRKVHDWPYATGASAADGPLHLLAPDGNERWYAASALTDSLTALTGLALHGIAGATQDATPGCFPGPRGGPGRTGIYPISLVPSPKPAQAFFDPAALILHPNPVSGDALKVRYVLGERATISLEAIDLSGRIVGRTEWEGNPGAGGETHVWSVRDLAPGVYVIRLKVRGASDEKTILRKVAVVR